MHRLERGEAARQGHEGTAEANEDRNVGEEKESQHAGSQGRDKHRDRAVRYPTSFWYFLQVAEFMSENQDFCLFAYC